MLKTQRSKMSIITLIKLKINHVIVRLVFSNDKIKNLIWFEFYVYQKRRQSSLFFGSLILGSLLDEFYAFLISKLFVFFMVFCVAGGEIPSSFFFDDFFFSPFGFFYFFCTTVASSSSGLNADTFGVY